LQREIINYFYKICELGDIPNYRERIHFIWPENYSLFSEDYPLCKLLYYSPLAMKRIKEISNGKFAFIIPGVSSSDMRLLAVYLGIPIFSGTYSI